MELGFEEGLEAAKHRREGGRSLLERPEPALLWQREVWRRPDVAGGKAGQARWNGLSFCEPKDREVWLATTEGGQC